MPKVTVDIVEVSRATLNIVRNGRKRDSRLVIAAAAIAAILIPSAGAMSASANLRPTSQAEIDQTRRISAAFARCIVRRVPKAASKFVLSPGQTKLREESVLLEPECLAAQPGAEAEMLSSTTRYFAYEFAEALVRAKLAKFDGDLKSAPLTEAEKLHPVSVTYQPEPKDSAADLAKAKALSESIMANVTIGLFGYCVARADSKAAHALLMTDVTTPAEREKFAALQSAMDRCLPEGQQLRSDMTTIRGTIALAYYQLAVAAKVTN